MNMMSDHWAVSIDWCGFNNWYGVHGMYGMYGWNSVHNWMSYNSSDWGSMDNVSENTITNMSSLISLLKVRTFSF